MGGHHSAVAIRPWEGTLHPERPRALQLECPGPDKQASPGDMDELGESRASGSLSADSGRLQPATLSHWPAGVSGQIGISPGKGAS